MKKLLLILLCLPMIGFGQQRLCESTLHDSFKTEYITYDGVDFSIKKKKKTSNAYKILFFGNSITNGFGGYGMAASNKYSDYCSILVQGLSSKVDSIAIMRIKGNKWEGLSDGIERLSFLDKEVIKNIDGDENLIVIQLGDNINTLERRKSFFNDSKVLIDWFRDKCPNAKILWVYGWYNTIHNMPLLRKVMISNTECQLVDISSLNNITNQNCVGSIYKRKERSIIILSKGVASHPNNIGMKIIADKIMECVINDVTLPLLHQ